MMTYKELLRDNPFKGYSREELESQWKRGIDLFLDRTEDRLHSFVKIVRYLIEDLYSGRDKLGTSFPLMMISGYLLSIESSPQSSDDVNSDTATAELLQLVSELWQIIEAMLQMGVDKSPGNEYRWLRQRALSERFTMPHKTNVTLLVEILYSLFGGTFSDTFKKFLGFTIDDLFLFVNAVTRIQTDHIADRMDPLFDANPSLFEAIRYRHELVLTNSETNHIHDCMLDYPVKISLECIANETNLPLEVIQHIAISLGIKANCTSREDVLSLELFAELCRFRTYPMLYTEDYLYVMDSSLLVSSAIDSLQVSIFQMGDESLTQSFNEHRMMISEQLAREYLERVFPSHEVYSNIFYSDTEGKRKEIDVMVVHDSCLLIIEVKSAAFTTSTRKMSSLNIFDDYWKSIGKGIGQIRSFRKALAESKELAIYDASGNQVDRLAHDNLETVIGLVVTLDWSMARSDHLRRGMFEGDLNPYDCEWTVSLPDLSAITWLLQEPIHVFNFLTNRLAVLRDKTIADTSDTVALMMYHEDGMAPLKVATQLSRTKEFTGIAFITEPIDKRLELLEDEYYYQDNYRETIKPRTLTGLQERVVEILNAQRPRGYIAGASILLDALDERISAIDAAIENAGRMARCGEIQSGPLVHWEQPLTRRRVALLIKSDVGPNTVEDWKLRGVGWMRVSHCKSGLLVMMDASFASIRGVYCLKDTDNHEELPLSHILATTGSVKKFQIGRNDKCFCGSGKKYKKCCLG